MLTQMHMSSHTLHILHTVTHKNKRKKNEINKHITIINSLCSPASPGAVLFVFEEIKGMDS